MTRRCHGKDEYEKILEDGYQGEKVSKSVALALALKQVPSWNDAQKKRQDDISQLYSSHRLQG